MSGKKRVGAPKKRTDSISPFRVSIPFWSGRFTATISPDKRYGPHRRLVLWLASLAPLGAAALRRAIERAYSWWSQ